MGESHFPVKASNRFTRVHFRPPPPRPPLPARPPACAPTCHPSPAHWPHSPTYLKSPPCSFPNHAHMRPVPVVRLDVMFGNTRDPTDHVTYLSRPPLPRCVSYAGAGFLHLFFASGLLCAPIYPRAVPDAGSLFTDERPAQPRSLADQVRAPSGGSGRWWPFPPSTA